MYIFEKRTRYTLVPTGREYYSHLMMYGDSSECRHKLGVNKKNDINIHL